MLAYESFFIIVLVSILGPVISLFALIFSNMSEKEIDLLKAENEQIALEKELHISKYTQLTQQIQPHFLFNVLNSLLSLIRLKRYTQLLQSFEHLILFLRDRYEVKEQLHPLANEVEHTEHYLAIQQLRFGERLHIHWGIDPLTAGSYTIPYLLQTLVENAFKHSLEVNEGVVRLEIYLKRERSKKTGDFIRLTVIDSGPGFAFNPLFEEETLRVNKGVGISNLSKRLHLLFGSNARIEVDDVATNRGMITVIWPYVDDTSSILVKEENYDKSIIT